jgi:acetyl esterase/lipase
VKVAVLLGPGLRLDRPGLETAAPGTPEGLEALLRAWGAALGQHVTVRWCGDEPALVAALTETGLHPVAVGEAGGVAVGADAVVLVPGTIGFDAPTLAEEVANAPATVVGVHPGTLRRDGRAPAATPVGAGCVRVLHGRGLEGVGAGLAHLAWSAAWPADVRRYGDDPEQVGDLRRPAGSGPRPVAVLVHGGFWWDPWERDGMDGLAVDLVRAGWVTWNVEYRRLGSGGGWPATADDVAAAVDHVAALPGCDPGRVVLVGHSAGGLLALLTAGRQAATVRPATVVAMAPVTDLDAALAQDLGGGAAGALLGAADPAEASPLDRLPLGVPLVIAHAADDAVVPVDQGRRYADAARAAGDDVTLHDPPAGGHLGWVDPSSAAWRSVRRLLPAG